MKSNSNKFNPHQVQSAADKEAPVCHDLREIVRKTRALSSDQILRRSQLRAKSGRGSSTSYIDIAKGEFPPPFPIGKRAIGFSANEIDAWIAARLYASQSKNPVNMKAFVTLLVQSRNRANPFEDM
ncbi:AlpA family transcriptional regulator [Undibacterium sp.]|uniref:helix-turn-helix transcriptional regulator n=1 Tax=Undibacterium sp. TaxID=1914977 RepID=UPI00272FAA25|nr:AlpA family phage regulatory protein [Undibacterium sp.]MDP1977613.1 AlpA family phage regulatory protein [Undibacterium sp.]